MSASRTAARVRATAAQVVDAVVSGGRSLDASLREREQNVAEADRALLRNLCFGSVRHHWRLAAWTSQLVDRPLKKKDSVVTALLHVGLYQLSGTRIPDHAVVSQTVEAARLLRRPKLAPLVNAVLRRFIRDDMAARPPATPEAEHDHPAWLIDALRTDWPDDWQAVLAANNERAPMWLRVNAARTDVAGYEARLATAELAAERLAGVDTALRLTQPLTVSRLPGFAEGEVSVQDAAAQLAAPWLLQDIAGRTQARVLDACAAPGGKSAHLLEAGRGIELTSVDIDAGRAADIDANLARLGLAATVLCADASNPQEWWDGKAFDGILLDAPCSASGVIRRHPDIKLLRRATDIDALAALQARLLERLWPLLAPGGRLLYVTCSVFAAENEAVVGDFLGATSDARENTMLQNNNIRDLMRRKACGYQVLPGTAGMDGFFYAC
ncbi:MAG: 16S rRNA (cytosine(967)-C(5))-methyltransferase RsmB, partial [Woeseiaceae bacterium]|nr:16S rRNA (cytosine(967)-C(5))-methyltransferase RsmB [Woeseiaceae bacterium]